MRNGKILATIGPASDSEESIERLLDAGANAFRLNFSHDTRQSHGERIDRIRSIEKKRGIHVGIVADLQGAKLRVGEIPGEGGVPVVAGDPFEFRLADGAGDSSGVSLPHPEIFSVAKEGMDILVEDGLLRFRVTDARPDVLVTTVVVGGKIASRKGVNIPGVDLPIAALTEKDTEDLAFALSKGVDWIALSFVQRPRDVSEAREAIAGRAGIISKIEKPSAVDRIDPIIDESDAIMIARGDLGVEMLPEQVPGTQKRIIRKCRQAGKSVIVATQMFDSMIRQPTPTRAEVSDVANALYDGADAVMLSGETAFGGYPIESVSVMRDVLRQTEGDPIFAAAARNISIDPPKTKTDVVALAAHHAALQISAKVIVVFSRSGATAIRCARYRSTCPLLCLTPDVSVARRMSLVWGVPRTAIKNISRFNAVLSGSVRVAIASGLAEKGDTIVVTAGAPFGGEGTTNTMSVLSA